MSRVIVITGGTSGIGKFLVKKFCKKNKVIVISKNEDKIKKVQQELNNCEIDFIKCDLMEDKEIKNTFDIIKLKYGKIDVLINNAAYDYMNSIENYDYNDFSKIINTNLLGKVFCIKYSVDLLRKSNYPCIINIASRLASRPMKNSSAYCCGAAAIVMLTRCAALELENYKIRVNCISPSLTVTPLSLKSYTTSELECTKNLSTRKRLCEPKDIYELTKFLIDKKSDYINGENVGINGGILLK